MKLLQKEKYVMDLSYKSDFNPVAVLAVIGTITVAHEGIKLSKKVYRRLRPAK
jgi:NOL1/NOP2/fmu family ribosome biogenesis protein